MKPTHTPTPWRVTDEPIEISGTFHEIVGANNRPTPILIERIDEDLSSRSCIENHKTNVAFICKAVNAHEKLIRACRAAADYWHSSDMDPCSDENLCLYCSALAEAEELV